MENASWEPLDVIPYCVGALAVLFVIVLFGTRLSKFRFFCLMLQWAIGLATIGLIAWQVHIDYWWMGIPPQAIPMGLMVIVLLSVTTAMFTSTRKSQPINRTQ